MDLRTRKDLSSPKTCCSVETFNTIGVTSQELYRSVSGLDSRTEAPERPQTLNKTTYYRGCPKADSVSSLHVRGPYASDSMSFSFVMTSSSSPVD